MEHGQQAFTGTRITLSEKLLRRIEALTANNDHGSSYLMAAKALGLDTLISLFTRINHRHEHLGYLRHDLAQDRQVGYTTLLKEAARLLSPAQYQRLYRSL